MPALGEVHVQPAKLGIDAESLEIRRHPFGLRLLAGRNSHGAPRRGEHLFVEQRPPHDRRRRRQQLPQLPLRGCHERLLVGHPAGRDGGEHPPRQLAAERQVGRAGASRNSSRSRVPSVEEPSAPLSQTLSCPSRVKPSAAEVARG